MQIIKIDKQYFYVENLSTQLSTGSHAKITLIFDIKRFPNYHTFFTDKYDKASLSFTKTDYQFTIEHNGVRATGCFIKMIDIDNMSLVMCVYINCDVYEEIPLSERRDETINQILDNNNLLED